MAITRSHWEERKNDILKGYPLAILIIDDQKYKPSAPLPTFVEIEDIPTLLIRQENGKLLIPDMNLERYQMEISISSSVKYIQEPDWKCDHIGCLPPVFNKGFIAGKPHCEICNGITGLWKKYILLYECKQNQGKKNF